MNYGQNLYQQPYRPYQQAPQVWQPPVQQPAWQQPAWQQPVQESMLQEPVPEPKEDPVVTAIRELTAEIAALRKAVTPRAVKKKEANDE